MRKIVKIGHVRNLNKECENLQILQWFLPQKGLFLQDMLHCL